MCSCCAMCSWLSVWDTCFWWGYVILELRSGLVVLDWFLCMEEICVSMIDQIELRWWSYDIIMHYEVMMIGENLIVLFMFAYQMLMNIEVKATPGWGLPHLKKRCGGDSRNWKTIWGWDSRNWKRIWGGTPAREKENMAGTPAIEWLYGGDSQKIS